MSLSTSRFAYADCYDILDTALERTHGARIAQPSESDCIFLRMRIHQARKIERDENAKTYERGHPMHGRSMYDRLVVRVREEDSRWYVYVEHGGVDTDAIEPLGEPLLGEPRPTPRITPPPPEDDLQAEFTEIEPEPEPKQITYLKRRI